MDQQVAQGKLNRILFILDNGFGAVGAGKNAYKKGGENQWKQYR
jgi:hypothetical protein